MVMEGVSMNRSTTVKLLAGVASLLVGVRYILPPRVIGTRDAIEPESRCLLFVDRVSVWVAEDADADAEASANSGKAGLCQHVVWSFRRVFLDDAVMHSFA